MSAVYPAPASWFPTTIYCKSPPPPPCGRSTAADPLRCGHMPELPEVETIRRQIAPALTGKRIVDAWHAPNPKFVSASDVVGHVVQSVSRRGKYLLFALDDDRELIVHLGMTGVVRF